MAGTIEASDAVISDAMQGTGRELKGFVRRDKTSCSAKTCSEAPLKDR